MKYYFHEDPVTGTIGGYSTIPDYINGTDKLNPAQIEVEDPPQDLLDTFRRYKYVNGEFVRMDDEEFFGKFPNYGKELPSPEEQQTDFNLDVDYRLSCLELGLV